MKKHPRGPIPRRVQPEGQDAALTDLLSEYQQYQDAAAEDPQEDADAATPADTASEPPKPADEAEAG